jgi:hypothetical protein
MRQSVRSTSNPADAALMATRLSTTDSPGSRLASQGLGKRRGAQGRHGCASQIHPPGSKMGSRRYPNAAGGLVPTQSTPEGEPPKPKFGSA